MRRRRDNERCMGLNVTQKLIRSQRAEEAKLTGREIGIYIDQTLAQDARHFSDARVRSKWVWIVSAPTFPDNS